ncbi:KR domain protein [Leptospira interrogans serovar Lora str. TE 1992]|uniref:KR domain protein n=1 Tax=Leptospira interrogans serovar Lora str. TE 1992 TaxID=1193028 RepID=M3F1A0_LEPIR|nr:KR domain protein [Leptospira interrogans serovar Lora str. TE 1992]
MDIKGKTVLVTGSASGLGKAMAEHFAKKGAKIVLSDISEEKLKEAEKDIKTLGTEVYSFKADVSRRRCRKAYAVCSKTIRKFRRSHIECRNFKRRLTRKNG